MKLLLILVYMIHCVYSQYKCGNLPCGPPSSIGCDGDKCICEEKYNGTLCQCHYGFGCIEDHEFQCGRRKCKTLGTVNCDGELCICAEGYYGHGCEIPDRCNKDNTVAYTNNSCVCRRSIDVEKERLFNFEQSKIRKNMYYNRRGLSYTGRNCDIPLDNNGWFFNIFGPQCQNDYGCIQSNTESCSYRKCACKKQYTGDYCEIKRDVYGEDYSCDGSLKCVISNTKKCVDGRCVCHSGYTGTNCDIEQKVYGENNSCNRTFPCVRQNTKRCIRETQYMLCDCYPGYGDGDCGIDCHVSFGCDSQRTKTCYHGAKHYVMSEGTTPCICTSGYFGQYCQYDLDIIMLPAMLVMICAFILRNWENGTRCNNIHNTAKNKSSYRDNPIYLSEECCICLEPDPDTVFYPCGHKCVHYICATRLTNNKCPICKQNIFVQSLT
jgi:hypothetical protein